VDEIVSKSLQAHGGIAKLRAIQTMKVTGETEVDGVLTQFTEMYKRPMKVRSEISYQGAILTRAYDGQTAWQIIPRFGESNPELMEDPGLEHMQQEADFDGPLVDYKQKGHIVELIGKEKMEGRDTYHLKVTLKNGDVRDFYLDASSFLPIKAIIKTTLQGQMREYERKYVGYKKIDNMTFAFSFEQREIGGQGPIQKTTFKKIELNIPLDDSLFKMPAVAPAPTASK
jgi:hypothetical protein